MRVGVVPGLVDCRQQRPADDDLDAALAAGAVVEGQILSGLGGVGKTQLAAGAAQRSWDRREVDLLVWVSATSRDSILATYARAADELTGVEDGDPADGADRFMAWLAGSHGRRWLIVLDDVGDPADLNGLWPPTTPMGRTVLTSRRRDHALTAGRHLIDVGLFTPDQALGYLRDKLGTDPDRLAEADLLAADLGFLPLALAQAAAFMQDRGLSCIGYRRRFADRRRRLDELVPEPEALPDEHRATIAVTWSLSADVADTFAPVGMARQVLQLAALLDPNAIPVTVFTAAAVLAYLSERRGQACDSDDATDALYAVRRLNLINLDATATIIGIHGLVQRAVREATPHDRRAILATTAGDALQEIWPPVERDAVLGQVLRTNTNALNEHAGPLLWHPETGGREVLFTAGTSLGKSGQVAEAAGYFQHLYATAEQNLGPDHPSTLNTRHDMACWQGEAGDPAGAAITLRELLTDCQRILGPDHIGTLTTRNDLACWSGKAGDPAGAAAAFQELLSDYLRVMGPDHPETLNAHGALALWRGLAGDLAGAASATDEVLTDYLRALGPDHPETLTTRSNLAHWRGEAGDPAGAATALQELLTDYLRVMGPDHPDTLTTRNNLSHFRRTTAEEEDGQ